MDHREPALSLRGIRKSFPGVVAVDGVDLDLYPGEIHALVGENGAGKSTLAAIAFGELAADEGSVQADGTVGLVHQHFELIGRLRVWQNVLLGREPHRGWRIDEAAARARVRALAQDNGLDIDPNAFVETLPVGVQQRVELLRELDREPAVLLLDEPTAALAPTEIENFFATVVQLAARGTAIMIVTHKLAEVMAYAARVTVMRHGRVVARMDTAQTDVGAIARAMVGGELPALAQRVPTITTPCLAVRLGPLAFDVNGGEIVGIAGVEGNGQTMLADALTGMIAYDGTIERRGTIGVIPQDRQREALVMNWPLVENVLLGRQHRPAARRGLTLDRARARSDARTIVERFDIRTASIDVRVRTLSGGNQQKVVVGRALIDEPDFVLAYNPTRGVDVGAAALVQSRLIEARNRGSAVLLISFELDEILALSDRVLVMYRGAIVGSFDHEHLDRAAIGRLMAGSS
ncbi:MAG TPA: ATP-binding cassette domain-containing protein [Candidatus Baltobacteraceae bacterium]|nr:ATP-binding cassette domain-containing protein [Candidatus Baltobacteraceae bacterium]